MEKRELDLFLEYSKTKDVNLRNRIVENNMKLARKIAMKYVNRGVEFDDLYQVSCLSLINAVERFDVNSGNEFATFAVPTIVGDIKKYFRDKEWSMSIPRRLKENSLLVKKEKDRLTSLFNREPNLKELETATKLSREDIIEALNVSSTYSLNSLERNINSEDDSNLFDLIGVNEVGYIRVEIDEIISKVLLELTDTYKYIFEKRFIDNMSQSEVAKKLNVSQMTVSRAEKAIIERFRKEVR